MRRHHSLNINRSTLLDRLRVLHRDDKHYLAGVSDLFQALCDSIFGAHSSSSEASIE